MKGYRNEGVRGGFSYPKIWNQKIGPPIAGRPVLAISPIAWRVLLLSYGVDFHQAFHNPVSEFIIITGIAITIWKQTSITLTLTLTLILILVLTHADSGGRLMKGIAPLTQHRTGEHYRSSMISPPNALISLSLYSPS